jgi:hypothetical protein
MNPVGPDFDEVVGEVKRDERERLRRVHDLLVAAGPPPELPPHLEAGPTLAMTLGSRRRRTVRRPLMLLAAAVAVLLIAFFAGYVTGNKSGSSGGTTLKLTGTAAAPQAQASLRIWEPDSSGNWPMELAALGLPRLPGKGYYSVFLVRNGHDFEPCGTFVVRDSNAGVTVRLNSPYRLHKGDSWVVTRQLAGDHTTGTVVLRPLT